MNSIEQMLTSMEVAEMVEKDHKELLKDIRRYCEQFSQGKIPPSDFFEESEREVRGKKYPCYMVTKKGCEFIAHKLTGVKGTGFTAKYINRFHDMEEVITTGISKKDRQEQPKKKNLSATNMLIKNITGIFKEAGVDPLYIAAEAKRLYKQEADIEISIPLVTDNSTQHLWDCTSIAKELGIMSESGRPHDKAVSAIIQKLDLFSDEVVKTAYSRNGHDGVTVQYKDSVYEKVREWLEENYYPTVIELELSNGNMNKCHVTYSEVA